MPATPAGERKASIAFMRPTVTEGELGGESESFTAEVRAKAKVLFGTGAERREAAAQGSVQSATFRVLSTARTRQVTERWRIRDKAGAQWGIGSISELDTLPREIEFVATRIASA